MLLDDSPQSLVVLVVGAFIVGWVIAKLGGLLSRRISSAERDPRDDRIRSLEMELRVARSDRRKVDEKLATTESELDESRNTVDDYARTMNDLHAQIERLQTDLRDSVKLTHELRGELSDRATENMRSTVKLQQVETELSVARASTDLISTGKLDYTVDGDDTPDGPQVVKSGA